MTTARMCVVCGNIYKGGYEFACSEECHKKLCEILVAMKFHFGGKKEDI
jgi:predicted nucleic acid-binding Zn ribbon protein